MIDCLWQLFIQALRISTLVHNHNGKRTKQKKSHLFDGLRRNYLKINYANLFPTSFQFTTFHDAVMQSGGPILVNEELVFSNFPLIAIFILCDFRSFRSYLNQPKMKTLTKILSLFVLTALFSISCSKSSDPAPTLVGTWKQTTTQLIGCSPNTFDTTETSCTTCGTYVFTATTFALSSGTFSYTGTYTSTGTSISLNFDPGAGSAFTLTGPYTLTASTLTMTFSYDQMGATNCNRVSKYTKQ